MYYNGGYVTPHPGVKLHHETQGFAVEEVKLTSPTSVLVVLR